MVDLRETLHSEMNLKQKAMRDLEVLQNQHKELKVNSENEIKKITDKYVFMESRVKEKEISENK